MKEVKVDNILLSNESNFALIAGLNVLEDEKKYQVTKKDIGKSQIKLNASIKNSA